MGNEFGKQNYFCGQMRLTENIPLYFLNILEAIRYLRTGTGRREQLGIAYQV